MACLLSTTACTVRVAVRSSSIHNRALTESSPSSGIVDFSGLLLAGSGRVRDEHVMLGGPGAGQSAAGPADYAGDKQVGHR